MKIDGLPPEISGVKNITDRKALKAVPAGRTDAPDTVELTVGMGRKELLEMSGSIPVEFPVREDVVETVAKRIAANTYDNPEISETVAERLLASPVLSGTTHGDTAPETSLRTEQVETALSRTSAGYYDQPDVLEAIAGKLVNALGLWSDTKA